MKERLRGKNRNAVLRELNQVNNPFRYIPMFRFFFRRTRKYVKRITRALNEPSSRYVAASSTRAMPGRGCIRGEEAIDEYIRTPESAHPDTLEFNVKFY